MGASGLPKGPGHFGSYAGPPVAACQRLPATIWHRSARQSEVSRDSDAPLVQRNKIEQMRRRSSRSRTYHESFAGGQITTRKPIIVVDDDTSMLRAIERALKIHGFDCVTFDNVDDFRTNANLDEAACVVLDINLAGASGIELRKELARAGRSVPVVFITGADSVGARSAALKAGCVGYLTKPFASALLMEAIEKCVKQGRRLT
jgi:ActR/RegA family two-component response regulator